MSDEGPIYADRREAGRRLASRLLRWQGPRVTVLGLPRGGVPVAAEIAERLNAALDVFVVRKVGAPGNPEYGLGAVVEGGAVLLDEDRVAELGLTNADLGPEIERQRREVEARVATLRGGRPLAPVEGRTVIVVDDGLATGATARAAIRALRLRRPERLVLAVGVAPPDTFALLRPLVDELVCPCVPEGFFAVGTWYRDFSEVTDADVLRILAARPARSPEVPVHG